MFRRGSTAASHAASTGAASKRTCLSARAASSLPCPARRLVLDEDVDRAVLVRVEPAARAHVVAVERVGDEEVLGVRTGRRNLSTPCGGMIPPLAASRRYAREAARV